ncbi:MAG: chemotaxis protein CheA [Proteobacteria bacterium]|nr:chemotaxis protein CheA [Pseudomonadota bacterium]
MKFDTEKYKILFITEAREHIENISKILERSKESFTEEDLNSLFRDAHSIKGISSAMGYTDIAELSHNMENILGKIRAGELLLDDNIRKILIKVTDKLWTVIEQIEKNEKYEDLQSLIDSIKNFQVVDKREDKNKISERAIVRIVFYDNIPSLSARAFLVYKNILSFGDVIESDPSIESIKKGDFKGDLCIKIIIKKTIDSLKKYISQLGEIKHFDISFEKSKEEKIGPEDLKDIGKPTLSKLVKVDVNDLDYFLNITGELLTIKTQIKENLKEIENIEVSNALNQMEILLKDLQNKVMKIRLVPLDTIFSNIPRWVRDLSEKLNKKINLEIKGEDIELDRSVVDALTDPILHIIRNSIDHGIESEDERIRNNKNSYGFLKVQATKEKEKVIISIEDDGRGIDLEKVKKTAIQSGRFSQNYINSLVEKKKILNLLTTPGLSTKETVTDISGRGVGLDVVKNVIESFGGIIDIDSEINRGTKISLILPSTISIVNILVFKSGDFLLATPVDRIQAINKVKIKDMYTLFREKGVILYNEEYIPAVYLNEKLGLKGMKDLNSDYLLGLVLDIFGKKTAVLVDKIIGYREVYLRTLNKPLSLLPGFYSSAILGDGTPILIMDLQGIIS